MDEDDPAMRREGPPDWRGRLPWKYRRRVRNWYFLASTDPNITVDFFAGTRSKSDLIIATPLALRLAAEEEGRQASWIDYHRSKFCSWTRPTCCSTKTGRPWNDV